MPLISEEVAGSGRTRVAILGRPNVGKSTFFNLLTGTRKAVVKNQPGVTRDVQVERAEIWGHEFEIMDTGGVTDASDTFSQLIKQQVSQVLSDVDVLVLVMDGKYGLCPEDRDIVQMALASQKSFVLVVNKVDSAVNADVAKSEFYEFGVDVFDASFEQRRGVAEICEWLIEQHRAKTGGSPESFKEPDFLEGEGGLEAAEAALEAKAEEVPFERRGVRLTIVGKPNVGKSSFCNYLIGEHRMLVSDIAGTTVDSIDTELVFADRKYILTDTAGMRRSAKRKEDVEIISAFKAKESVDRSDVVLLMIDGTLGPSDQDTKLMQYILEQHKAVLLVVNKTDLGVEQIPEFRKTLRKKISEEFHFYEDVPIAFISAKTGAGVDKLFAQIDEIWRKLHTRVSTSDLNDFFFEVIRRAPAPVHGTKNVKFYYLTQTKQVPPSFIAFANYPESVSPSYRRFLRKNIQKKWGLEGIPIRIYAMKSRSH